MLSIRLVPSICVVFPVDVTLEILQMVPSRHMMSPLRTLDRSLEPLGAGLVVRRYSSS